VGTKLPHGKEHNSPTFWPLSAVAKWSPISATAELLLSKNHDRGLMVWVNRFWYSDEWLSRNCHILVTPVVTRVVS